MKFSHRNVVEDCCVVVRRLEGEPEFPRSPSNSPFVPSIPSAVENKP